MSRRYDKEFKLEAVRMASEPGVTAKDVERRLGIGQGVLSRWRREFKNDGSQAFRQGPFKTRRRGAEAVKTGM